MDNQEWAGMTANGPQNKSDKTDGTKSDGHAWLRELLREEMPKILNQYFANDNNYPLDVRMKKIMKGLTAPSKPELKGGG